MIIGNGMLAKSFSSYQNRSDILIFASGVSNSQEVCPSEFKREKNILLDAINQYPQKTLVYFSTCSIFDPSLTLAPYVIHKKEMEAIISKFSENYYIFRLPIVVGKTNNSTIINYLCQKIDNNEHFELWTNSTRNIIDSVDVYQIVNYIIENKLYKNEIINVASAYRVTVKAIVEMIERIYHKKALYSEVQKGAAYNINISKIENIIKDLNIKFDDGYLHIVIDKYFKPNEKKT